MLARPRQAESDAHARLDAAVRSIPRASGLWERESKMHRRTRICIALAAPVARALLAAGTTALAARPNATRFRVHRVCRAAPRPGSAACLGLKLVPDSLTSGELRSSATRQRREAAANARPAVTNPSPEPGFLTPQLLHAAYALPDETPASSLQTVAVVDAF